MSWDNPPSNVLIILASLAVHLDEMIFGQAHDLDIAAVQGLLKNADLREWLESVPEVLLPVKR